MKAEVVMYFEFEAVYTMRIQSGYAPDLFPLCARPIMQMCAIRSTSCALQASAYFIFTHEARSMARTAQMVYKPPYYYIIYLQTSVIKVGIFPAPFHL